MIKEGMARKLVDADIPEDVLDTLAAERLGEKIAARLMRPEIFLSPGFF